MLDTATVERRGQFDLFQDHVADNETTVGAWQGRGRKHGAEIGEQCARADTFFCCGGPWPMLVA